MKLSTVSSHNLLLAGAAVAVLGTIAWLMFLRSSVPVDPNKVVVLGSAVAIKPLMEEAPYRDTLNRYFAAITPENAMKFTALHPKQDVFDFKNADAIVDFATVHKMRVRGHTLVWYKQIPAWLAQGSFSRDQLMAILRNHILTVVGRYRGRVAAWDVVNEAVADDGSMRNSLWLKGIGPDYIAMAFGWAHEADPTAKLFYNDYGGEGRGPKSDAIYRLVKDLRQRGVPVSGVGLQMHISIGQHPDPSGVLENMDRMAALGLEADITEMDVAIGDGHGNLQSKLSAQASIFQDFATVCRRSSACHALTTWGFADRYARQADIPLLFDSSYRPNSAFQALAAALATQPPGR